MKSMYVCVCVCVLSTRQMSLPVQWNFFQLDLKAGNRKSKERQKYRVSLRSHNRHPTIPKNSGWPGEQPNALNVQHETERVQKSRQPLVFLHVSAATISKNTVQNTNTAATFCFARYQNRKVQTDETEDASNTVNGKNFAFQMFARKVIASNNLRRIEPPATTSVVKYSP